jgi:hypothetical protein
METGMAFCIFINSFMDVYFNFPNGQILKYDMPHLPRVGELVDFFLVSQKNFKREEDWINWQSYKAITWEVERVLWIPNGQDSYVNLILKRIDKPTN